MNVLNDKDVMREILSHIKDTELLKVCSVNRRCWNIVCDDNFLKRRLKKYLDVEKYRNEKNYKNFFSWICFLVLEMKTKYKFIYSGGNIKHQHNLLNMSDNINDLLIKACDLGEFAIVKHAVGNGADIHYLSDGALFCSGIHAHLEIVKYLTLAPQIEILYENVLRAICEKCEDKHLPIVKHLVENGIKNNIDISLNSKLAHACKSGHIDTIKYLIEKGANKFHPYVVKLSLMSANPDILKNL
jgi:hypothetical protein